MIKVVNVYHDPYDVYIGRPDWRNRNSQEHFGNPYTHLDNISDCIKVATVEEAVASYKNWLLGLIDTDKNQERRQWILNNLKTLFGKSLGCFCESKQCHGYVLKELAEIYRG